MKDMLKQIADKALVHSPAQTYFHWRAERRLTVLAYHGIEDAELFAAQLDYIRAHMHPVSLERVCAVLDGKKSLPRGAVLITFDDGERSVLEQALPLLRERGLPGVVFVVAGLLDTQQPFWWVEAATLISQGGQAADLEGLSPVEAVRALKQMPNHRRLQALAELRQRAPGAVPIMPQLRRRELALFEAAGIEIGSHTLTHPCLNQCDEATIVSELYEAHHILSEVLGHAPRAFAYPNGDEDRRVVRVLTDLGYQSAFLFDHRVSTLPPGDRFRISRVRVNAYANLDRFRIIVSGLHPALHSVRGTNKRNIVRDIQ